MFNPSTSDLAAIKRTLKNVQGSLHMSGPKVKASAQVAESESSAAEQEERKLSPQPDASSSLSQSENKYPKPVFSTPRKSTLVIPKKSSTVAPSRTQAPFSTIVQHLPSSSSKQSASVADDPSSDSFSSASLKAVDAIIASVPPPSSSEKMAVNQAFTQCMGAILSNQGVATVRSLPKLKEYLSLAHYLLIHAPAELIPTPLTHLAAMMTLTSRVRVQQEHGKPKVDPHLIDLYVDITFELTRVCFLPQSQLSKGEVDTLIQTCQKEQTTLRSMKYNELTRESRFKIDLIGNMIQHLNDVGKRSSTLSQCVRDLFHPELRASVPLYSPEFKKLSDGSESYRLITALHHIHAPLMTFDGIMQIIQLPRYMSKSDHNYETFMTLHSILLGRALLELAKNDGTVRDDKTMTFDQRAFLSWCVLHWTCRNADGKREAPDRLSASIYKDRVHDAIFELNMNGFLYSSNFGQLLDFQGKSSLREAKIHIVFDLLECHGETASHERAAVRFDTETLATLADCILDRIICGGDHQAWAGRYLTTTPAVREILNDSWLRVRPTMLTPLDQYEKKTKNIKHFLAQFTDIYISEMLVAMDKITILNGKELQDTGALKGTPTPLSAMEAYITELEVEAKERGHAKIPRLYPYTLNEAIREAASLQRPLLIYLQPASCHFTSVEPLVECAAILDDKFVTWIVLDHLEEAKAVRKFSEKPFLIMHGRQQVEEQEEMLEDKKLEDWLNREWNKVEYDVKPYGSQLIEPEKKVSREEWLQYVTELKKPLQPCFATSFADAMLKSDAAASSSGRKKNATSRPQSSSSSKTTRQNQGATTEAEGEHKVNALIQEQVVIGADAPSLDAVLEEKKDNAKTTKEQKVDGEEEDEDDVDELEQKKKDGIKVKSTDSQPDNTAGAGGPAIDDRPTGDDKLSHGKYAEKLAEVLCSPRTQPPITVGVYAQWGGGKSFFLEKLKSFLLSKLDTQNALWQESQDEESRRQDEIRSQDIGTFEAISAYKHKWAWLLNRKREEKQKKKKKSARRRKGGEEEKEESEEDDEEETTTAESDPLAEAQPTSWWHRFRPQYSELQTDDGSPAVDPKSTQRPPQPVPRLVRFAKKIGLQYTAMKAIMRIWKVMPRANRDVDSIKPLPVRMKFIEFNSWLYSGSDCLWAAFASHLFEQTEEHFGSLTTRIYRARYNDAFGKLSKTLLITVVIIFGLIVAAGICVWRRIGPFAENDGEDTSDIRTKAFAGLGSAFAFAFLGLLASSRDVISNLIRSQADEVLRTMDRPDFSSRMGFMNSIKTEIDIISSLMRHGEFYDDETGEEYRSQFVIFIDDLDRCPADKVVEVLKALVLLFSSPNAPFIAVLAIDPRLIVQAIETVHAIGGHNRGTQGPGGSAEAMVNGYEYLDKIVQLPFCFPDLQATDKHRLLNSFLPLDQNLKEAAQQSDYREVATLIMKSFLGNPQIFREELKACIHQQLDEWLRVKVVQCIEQAKSTFVNPLNKKGQAEYTKYVNAKKLNDVAANARIATTSITTSDSDSELQSIFSILIPLVTSTESRFSVQDQMKSHPSLTFSQIEKRVKRELKRILHKTEMKYTEQYKKEKLEAIALWKDEITRARRQAIAAQDDAQTQSGNNNQQPTEENELTSLRQKVREAICSPRVEELLAGMDDDKPRLLHPKFLYLNRSFDSVLSNSSVNPILLEYLREMHKDFRTFDFAASVVHTRLVKVMEKQSNPSHPASTSSSIFETDLLPLMDLVLTYLTQITYSPDKNVDIASFQFLSQRILKVMYSCIQTTMKEDSMRWMREENRAAVKGAKECSEEEEKKEEEAVEMEEQPADTFLPVQDEAQPTISSPTITDDIPPQDNPLSSPSDPLPQPDPMMSPAIQSLSKKKAWDTTLNVDLLATGTPDTTQVPLTASSAIVSPFIEDSDALPDPTPLPPHPFAVPTPDIPKSAQTETLMLTANLAAKVGNIIGIPVRSNITEALANAAERFASSNNLNDPIEPTFATTTAVEEEKTNELVPTVAMQEAKVNDAESVATFNAKPRPKRKILPRQVIMDYGFTNHEKFKGAWIDIQGQGVPNDYARFVQPSESHEEPFLSVALAGSIFPYSPSGQFEWHEQTKSVRVATSQDQLFPVIYNHPFFRGGGHWVMTASAGFKYARYIRDGASRYLSVASTNLTTHSRPGEYEYTDSTEKIVTRNNLMLEGTWWNAQDQAWYEWKLLKEGAPPAGASNEGEQVYTCFRIDSDPSKTNMKEPVPSYLALRLAFSGALAILGPPHAVHEWRGLGDKKNHTHDKVTLQVHNHAYLYAYHLYNFTDVLKPASPANRAGEENAPTWYAHGSVPSTYGKRILEPATSFIPNQRRRNVLTIENPANSPQEIWITATYSYANCSKELLKDAPTASLDYSFTLTATLMSAQDHILDRRIMRGVILPASTPTGHPDLAGWCSVSCVFRPDELIAPHIPIAKIQFQETCSRVGTESKELTMMVRPQALGFTSIPQTREELWRRAEEKVKIENVKRNSSEQTRSARAEIIGALRGTDLILTHLLKTRELPHYRTTPPGFYLNQTHLPSSLLDETFVPTHLQEMYDSLIPIWTELVCWVSNPLSTCDEWDSLRTSRTHTHNIKFPVRVPNNSPAAAFLDTENKRGAIEFALRVLALDEDPLLRDDKSHDPHEHVAVLKKCVAKWVLRSVYPNWHVWIGGDVEVRDLQYLTPISLPRSTSTELEVRFDDKDQCGKNIIYSLVCQAHMCQLYLMAPNVLPMFEWFSEAILNRLDKMGIEYSIAAHARFLQFPIIKLLSHYADDARFVTEAKKWQDNLITLKAIPEIWREFEGRRVGSEYDDVSVSSSSSSTTTTSIPLKDITRYNWLKQLETLLQSEEPQGGVGTLKGAEMRLSFWKEMERYPSMKKHFPEVLEMVKERIKDLTAEVEAKEDEDDENAHAGFSLRPIEIVAIGAAAPFLDGNPRRIKRIMNIYNVSRLLVERKRHQHHYRDECTHSFCQQYNADKKSNRSNADSLAASLAFNPLASEMSLHSVFHPPRLTYSLVRPGLFRFILLLEQWPYRTAWLLHIIAQSSKKWKHAQEAIDRVHQTKVDAQKKEKKNNGSSNNKEKQVDSSSRSAAPTAIDTIPIDAAMSCGMFPPSMSLLELYRFVQPLIYGHRQPRNYEATALDTKGRNGNSTLNANQLVPHNHHNHHHHHAAPAAAAAKSKFRTLQNVMKAANAFRSLDEDEELHQELIASPVRPSSAVVVPTSSSSSNDLHPAFGVVNKSDFDSSVRRHVHDTEGLLAMDSDPDNFALFLALPLDESKDALDPYDIDLQVDDMTQVDDIDEEEGTEEELLLSVLHSDMGEITSRSRPQTATRNNGGVKFASMKTSSSSAAHTSLLSPSLMHICDLADLSYLAFNLNPALKRQVAILADLTAAYQPVETLLHQYVLKKYAPQQGQSRSVSRPRSANGVKLQVHPPSISIPAAISSTYSSSTAKPSIGAGFARAISRVKTQHKSDLLEEKEAHDTALSPSSSSLSFPMSPFSPAVVDTIKVLPRPPSSQRITGTTFQRVSH